MTDSVVAGLAWYTHKKKNDTQILHTQCSSIDRRHGVLTSYDSYMIQKNADKPEMFKSKFSLQIYIAKELRDMLARNGFETLGHYDMDGSEFLGDKTANILTVAKKK